MTLLVHLIDDRDRRSVKLVGIRGGAAKVLLARGRIELDHAVFCTPVLPNYFATHQWLRELKRRGMRTIAAVRFRLRADTHVYVGGYNTEHRLVPLGHAVGLFMRAPDPRGWEIVVPRGISPKAIHDTREVNQVVGWRFYPDSHAKPWTCVCEYCLESLRGDIKGRRRINRLLGNGAL